MFLFSFRRAEPAAKRAASCQGRLLLEASKNFTRRHNIAAQDAQFFLARLNTMVEAGACKSLRPRGCEEAKAPPQCSPDYPYRSIDGSCNNLQNPRWGAASIPFVRYLAPAYEDGVDALRGAGRTGLRRLPSPRAVSWMLHVGGNRPPLPHLTLMIMQWGQFMDHDIVHTPEAAGVDEHGETMPVECCRDGVDTSNFFDLTQDCRPIDVSTDPLFSANGRTCMRFVRSLIASRDCLLGPREQLNQITAYIDGSMVYGSTVEVSQELRLYRGGRLNKSSAPSGHGDERVNEQPALASMHTLWLRVHENLVTQLARLNPHWDDETLYQESRRIVVALIQQTTYREFLPLVLGDNLMQEYDLYPRTRGLYDTYDPSVDSSIANSFGTAAYRFGHTLVNDVLRGSGKNVTLSGSFMDPHVLHESGTSPSDLLSGLANSHSQAADSYLVPTLTNKLFARPDEPVGLDLMALNIQACGLSAVSSFPQLGKVTSPQVAFTLSSLYGSVDDVDLFPAGLAETALSGGLLGPTLSCIIAQQFSNLKKGDRFWYENLNQPKPFAIGQLDSIRQISLTGVMCEHLRLSHLQPRPFLTTEEQSSPLFHLPAAQPEIVARESVYSIPHPTAYHPAANYAYHPATNHAYHPHESMSWCGCVDEAAGDRPVVLLQLFSQRPVLPAQPLQLLIVSPQTSIPIVPQPPYLVPRPPYFVPRPPYLVPRPPYLPCHGHHTYRATATTPTVPRPPHLPCHGHHNYIAMTTLT
ncbi:Peroxidasin-like 4, partial [Homarus americanus]